MDDNKFNGFLGHAIFGSTIISYRQYLVKVIFK